MTENETIVIETYRRVINTLRHRHLSNCEVQRLPRSLLEDVLWLESELRHSRSDSAEFRRARVQIEAFLLSSYGVTVRREAHRSALEHPRPHPQGLSNTK